MSNWRNWLPARPGQEFLASIVVFLVALPLCMGIAIASGAPPALGLVTGIVGGLIVGFLAGSPLQVSGPAAGLAVIVWEMVNAFGLPMLGTIVLMAGALQILAGLLGIGQWFRAVSPAIIHGMLAGIGVLIFGSQFHVMVDDKPKGSGIENLVSLPEAFWKGVVPFDGSSHSLSAAIGLLTIGSIILWNLFAPRRVKMIPGALVGVLVATAIAAVFRTPVDYVSVPSNFFSLFHFPTIQSLTNAMSWPIIQAAIALAFVASAETLLCATAVDQMHKGPRTRYSKELFAQGVGNAICGFLGALPMTGVIVRSAANVEAGAQTRLSAIMHGAWLLAFVAVLPFVLEMVPIASLAAILVFTAYKLVNLKVIPKLLAYGKSEVAIYLLTLSAIVATNLLEGVLIGLGAALLKLVFTVASLRAWLEPGPEARMTLHLDGKATFLLLPKLASVLEKVPAGTELHVNPDKLIYIDHACLDLLQGWEKQHAITGGKLEVDWVALEHKYHSWRPSIARRLDVVDPA